MNMRTNESPSCLGARSCVQSNAVKTAGNKIMFVLIMHIVKLHILRNVARLPTYKIALMKSSLTLQTTKSYFCYMHTISLIFFYDPSARLHKMWRDFCFITKITIAHVDMCTTKASKRAKKNIKVQFSDVWKAFVYLFSSTHVHSLIVQNVKFMFNVYDTKFYCTNSKVRAFSFYFMCILMNANIYLQC